MNAQRMLEISTKFDVLRAASIKVILENQDPSGAYIASPNFEVYNYSWFRDGAFIADALLNQGEVESARLFHEWVARVVLQRSIKIELLITRKLQGIEILPDEHLHCRYTANGEEAAESWTNFQLDGFGIWIWALNAYQDAGQFVSKNQVAAVELLIPYLANFWNEPSFDWWEESFGYQHVSTLGSIAAGLKACSTWNSISTETANTALKVSGEITQYILEFGLVDGRLTKWIGGDGLDASLAALVAPFKILAGSSEIANRTISAIEQQLGRLGTYRHKEDVYFGGGRWIILSAFLGLAHVELGHLEIAEEILEWISTTVDENFHLPEQLTSPLLYPQFQQEWIDRWGIPAIPLLWSHAMFLKLLAVITNIDRI